MGECFPDAAGERLRAEGLPHGVSCRRCRAITVRQAVLQFLYSPACASRLRQELRRHAIVVDLEGATFGALEERLLVRQLLL